MAIDFATAGVPKGVQAKQKRAFTITVSTTAVPVKFTNGRIASVILPSGSVWVGGDSSVAVSGPSGGVPLIFGQPFICGPEEGNSETWLIATAPVTVACMEFLP